jgi:hypothetical protein
MRYSFSCAWRTFYQVDDLMHMLDQFIVLVEGESLGSGVIIFPEDTLDKAYVLTAAHILFDASGKLCDLNRISVQFLRNAGLTYRMQIDDIVVTGDLNFGEDIALLIIPNPSVPCQIDRTKAPIPVTLRGIETHCEIKGFPNATDNQKQRSLLNANILPDKDTQCQIQVEVSDPLSLHYNSGDLFKGFSGSPIFFRKQEGSFVFAIFSEYEDLSRRVTGVNISCINPHLEKVGLAQMPLRPVELNHEILRGIDALRTNSKRVLNRIKDKIGSLTLPRIKTTEEIISLIRSNDCVLISGVPGVGKSGVSKKAVAALVEEYEVIALQGEQLDRPSLNAILRSEPFFLESDLESIFDSPELKTKKLIFIDSVEKILEASNSDTVLDFFGLLSGRKNVKIVLTCRSYGVENLKIRFLQHIISLMPYVVTGLEPEELDVVSAAYPAIKALLSKPSLKKILEIPFNLDKATMISLGEHDELVSERDFMHMVWNHVIAGKEREGDGIVARRREQVIEGIALTRAEKMSIYVEVPDTDLIIVEKLKGEELIEENPVSPGFFAVSHDIYEDWALVRFIDRVFNRNVIESNGASDTFFASIGSSPAMRRAFRIWISERVVGIDFNVSALIKSALSAATVKPYWKDEILIAIIQSPASDQFLRENKHRILSEERAIFKRILLLLQVSGQGPNLNYLNLFSQEKKHQVYHPSFLIPQGLGWESLILFINSNISDFKNDLDVIISFLLQWSRKLDAASALPSESRPAGLILLVHVEKILVQDSEEILYSGKNPIKEIIILILKLTNVLKDELENLIERAIEIPTFNQTKQQRHVFDPLIEHCLSWTYSGALCSLIPRLVIKVAEREWFFRPTDKNEQLNPRSIASLIRLASQKADDNEIFGVPSEYKREYSPSSAFQTAIPHLLVAEPELTVKFIVKLFNHSIDAFRKSDFLTKDTVIWKADERKEVEIIASDGTKNIQLGSEALWCMYRATKIATPDLLQSVLMALERHLLQHARAIEKKGIENSKKHLMFLDFVFDHILKNCESVSPSAVLVSVATAYPNVIGPRSFPLLRSKEFFRWDLNRYSHERQAVAPIGQGVNGQLVQQERVESNRLPHRQSTLEQLMVKLGFEGYAAEIATILDEFTKRQPQEEAWKLALNRMDYRKFQFVSKIEGNKYLLESKVDNDLRDIVRKNVKEEKRKQPVREASYWALKKFKKEDFAADGFDQWKKHYSVLRRYKSQDEFVHLYYYPGVMAAVGIRDFYDDLSAGQLRSCVDQVFAVVAYELDQSLRPYHFDEKPPFSPFEFSPAFLSLIEVTKKGKGKILHEAKYFLLSAMIFLKHSLERDDLIKAINDDLWNSNPEYSKSLVTGLVRYSGIAMKRIEIQHATQSRRAGYDIEGEIKRWNSDLSEIIQDVLIGQNNFNISEIDGNVNSIYYLAEALQIAPPDSSDADVKHFYPAVVEVVMQHLHRDDDFGSNRIGYEIPSLVCKRFAEFLLQQNPEAVAIEVNRLLSLYFEQIQSPTVQQTDFICDVFSDVVYKAMENDCYVGNFRIIWTHLAKWQPRFMHYKMSEVLLLDLQFLNYNKSNWSGLIDQKFFFEPIIRTTGALKSSARLVSGIGFKEFLPDGILWIRELMNEEVSDKQTRHYLERLSVNIFFNSDYRRIVKSNPSLRDAFIEILDELINRNSASAFLIREDFISVRKL